MVGDLYPEFYPPLLPPAFSHRGPSGDLPETSSSSSCKASVKASSPQPPPSPPLSDGPLADALLLCEETLLSQGESEVEDVLFWADGEKAGPGATAPGDPPSELGLLWWERRRALPAAWQVQSEEPGDNRDLLVPDSDDVAVAEEDEGAGGRAPTTWRKGPARSPCWPHDEAAAGAREVPRAAEEPLPTSSPGDSKVGGEEEKTRRPVASPPGSSGYHCNESDSEDQVVITDYWFPEE